MGGEFPETVTVTGVLRDEPQVPPMYVSAKNVVEDAGLTENG